LVVYCGNVKNEVLRTVGATCQVPEVIGNNYAS